MNKWYFVVHFHSYYFPPCLFLYPSCWFEGHLSEGFLFSAQGSLFCFPLAFLIVFLVAPFVLHPSSSLPLTAYSFLSGLSFSGSLSLNVFCFSILVYEIFSSCAACHAVKRGNPHFSCVCACTIASEYWERAHLFFFIYAPLLHYFFICGWVWAAGLNESSSVLSPQHAAFEPWFHTRWWCCWALSRSLFWLSRSQYVVYIVAWFSLTQIDLTLFIL